MMLLELQSEDREQGELDLGDSEDLSISAVNGKNKSTGRDARLIGVLDGLNERVR